MKFCVQDEYIIDIKNKSNIIYILYNGKVVTELPSSVDEYGGIISTIKTGNEFC